MFDRRTPVALALLALTATALADSGKASGNKNQSNSQNSSQNQSERNSTLSRFVGEWEGQVSIVGNDGMTSASFCDASLRFDDQGRLLACFTGTVQGKAFEASTLVTAQGQSFLSQWADNRTSEVRSASGSPSGSELILNSSDKSFRQTFKVQNDNRLTIDLYSVNKEGKASLLLSVDMDRLAKDVKSTASANFDSSPLLGKLRKNAVAGVSGE
jgi:hypothetical protein